MTAKQRAYIPVLLLKRGKVVHTQFFGNFKSKRWDRKMTALRETDGFPHNTSLADGWPMILYSPMTTTSTNTCREWEGKERVDTAPSGNRFHWDTTLSPLFWTLLSYQTWEFTLYEDLKGWNNVSANFQKHKEYQQHPPPIQQNKLRKFITQLHIYLWYSN